MFVSGPPLVLFIANRPSHPERVSGKYVIDNPRHAKPYGLSSKAGAPEVPLLGDLGSKLAVIRVRSFLLFKGVVTFLAVIRENICMSFTTICRNHGSILAASTLVTCQTEALVA